MTTTISLPARAYFVAEVLPAVQRRARRAFRLIRCPGRRDDALQDACLLAWADFARLVERGIQDTVSPRSLAFWAVLRTRMGRKPYQGTRKGRRADLDALSWKSSSREGYSVEQLGDREQALSDPRPAGPAAVAFRLDFTAFLARLTERERQAVALLATGEGACRVALRLGLRAGWIGEHRAAWQRAWREFA